MDYTNKHKLSLPSYNDKIDIEVINNNMKILDNRLKNINLSDNILTVDGEQLDTSNLMPRTGGNFTGDVTIKGSTPLYSVYNESGTYEQTSDWGVINWNCTKYSDGSMTITLVVRTVNTGNYRKITLPQPFANTNYSVQITAQGNDPYPTSLHSDNVDMFNRPTTTDFYLWSANWCTQNVIITGQWK